MRTNQEVLINPGFTRIVSTGADKATVDQLAPEHAMRLKLKHVRQEAFAEAKKDMEKELAADRQRNKELISALEAGFDEFADNIEKKMSNQLIDLSIKMAEIIIRRKLPDYSMIRDIIHETLAPLTDFQGARVRLNADDAEEILKIRETGGSQDISDRIEIVPDTSLDSGDVMIESRNGYFDARITERLELLSERLKERCRDNNADNQ